ncbi:hypothetical protein BaRGS_00037737 [Batillaria attramentaria]|uniref:Uncharacterized protein n=1 Tax=Batillaria attramentaria TaxID=370345 RepID=A0ABD0J831_9CAEN
MAAADGMNGKYRPLNMEEVHGEVFDSHHSHSALIPRPFFLHCLQPSLVCGLCLETSVAWVSSVLGLVTVPYHPSRVFGWHGRLASVGVTGC